MVLEVPQVPPRWWSLPACAPAFRRYTPLSWVCPEMLDFRITLTVIPRTIAVAGIEKP